MCGAERREENSPGGPIESQSPARQCILRWAAAVAVQHASRGVVISRRHPLAWLSSTLCAKNPSKATERFEFFWGSLPCQNLIKKRKNREMRKQV